MATLTVTQPLGGTSAPAEMTYVNPTQVAPPSAPGLEVTGVNGPFLTDFLSAALAHERGGVALYTAVATRTNNPVLKKKYVEFGAETLQHADILEELVRSAGGDPMYVSPAARATEKAGNNLIETTFMLNGSIDLLTQELVMLEAVLLAEAKCHSNWQILSALAADLPEPLKASFTAAVQQVEPQEDEHAEWATDMRRKMVTMQVKSSAMQKVGLAAEEMMAKVQSMFS
jgi:rubrerythrin